MNATDKKSGAALQFFGHRSFNRERNPTTVQCALLSIQILKLVHINRVYNIVYHRLHHFHLHYIYTIASQEKSYGVENKGDKNFGNLERFSGKENFRNACTQHENSAYTSARWHKFLTNHL